LKNWLLGYPGATLLVLVHAAIALWAASHKSCHFDENLHIISGYSYWLHNDYRLQPENGNLPQRWVALPFLFTRPTFPKLDQKNYFLSKPWPLANQFLFEDNDGDALLMQSRAMVVLLSIALGLFVYGWSRKLFGRAGGMISLCLYAFSPTILANGAIATSDLAASLFFLASTYCLWELLREVSVRSVLLSVAAMTGLFLAKFSAGLIVPIGLLLVVVRVFQRRSLSVRWGQRKWELGLWKGAALLTGLIVVHGLCVALGIWASFGFRYAMFARDDPRDQRFPEWAKVLELDSRTPLEVIQWCRTHEVLPEAYLYGLAHTLSGARYRPGFLHGKIRLFGWREFFPLAFLWKTPLPVFVLAFLALLALALDWQWPRLLALAPLLVLFVVYWIAAIFSHLNIGHRHILPTYPPLFILCGAAVRWFQPGMRFARIARGIVAVALSFQIGETLYYYPHYLSYFNQVVGGPSQGYRYLIDSSCDWGQEMKGLKQWLDEHPTDEPIYHFNFGPGGGAYYHLPTREFDISYDFQRPLHHDFKPGLYCVGATFLQNVYSSLMGHWNGWYEEQYRLRLAYFQDDKRDRKNDLDEAVAMNYLVIGRLMSYLRCKKEPIAQVGYSKLIYHLSEEDLQRALFGPPWEHRMDVEDDYRPARYHVNEHGEVVE